MRHHRTRTLRGALGVLAALALTGTAVGCSDEEDGGVAGGEPTTSSTTGAPPADGQDGGEGQGGGTDLTAPVRLVDLDLPLDETIAATAVPGEGSSSVLVAERAGRVHEVVLDGQEARLLDGPLLDVEELVGETTSERGLLGVAVHPDGSSLVLSYTDADDGSNRIERYELSGEPGALEVAEGSRSTLLVVEQPYGNHNGGHVTFGPDELLYVGIGDGGAGGDPEGNAQDPTTLLGKLLRIDASGDGDVVPADNPFVDEGDGVRPEIWATGLRNPWRFSFDPQGDLWVADVGQNRFEELNRLRAGDGAGRGANFGWDLYEGDERFDDADPAPGGWSDGPFVEPLHTYGREGGCSITGGLVHDGSSVASLEGVYLFADYCGQGVRALVEEGDGVRVEELPGTELAEIVAFAEGPAGEVLVISLGDGVSMLVAG